ncbi:MAG: flagellar export protein FliJ [Gammaproteobacteria bacterium]
MKHRLDIALDMAVREEQAQTLKLARLNEQMQRQLAQQRQLERYGAEYSAALAVNAERVLSADAYKDRHAFIKQIQTSIQAQQRGIHELRKRVDSQSERWRAARTRVKSLERSIEKARLALATRREQRSERLVEEWAQRQGGGRSAA